MATVPPPQGVSEVDYEAIEAAVTETVRGRWFLREFARRNRTVEMRQLLDAMARLEGVVTSGQTALPADPSVRLLMQRIKEVAGQLDRLSIDMRAAGVDEHYAAAVEKEARAVSGMLRGPTLPRDSGAQPSLPRTEAAPPRPAIPAARPAPPVAPAVRAISPSDPRLTALSELDQLSLAEKLALFA